MANSLLYKKITGRLCFKFTSLRSRDHALRMEKQKSLESLKTAEMSGLYAGIRKESGRFSAVIELMLVVVSIVADDVQRTLETTGRV